MSDVAIRVDGLSKLYRIGAAQPRYQTLRDQLSESLSSPFRGLWSAVNGRPTFDGGSADAIWALKNVSFDVMRGEVVGVIGPNGAGKTTLLKILSRITEPTEGRAEIHGRVGSLLEVGTGFHPELTGRENIFLNGAILGMKEREIDCRFDEIVAFAQVEEFIDTPVKHYSSGMAVRLAFAVAAHLDPEILLVDEVLAVGDWGFQRKCLGKMGEVALTGRTVLFVSHNLAAVESFCTRGVLLDRGRLVADGSIRPVTDQYVRSLDAIQSQPITERTDRQGNGCLRFISFRAQAAPEGTGSMPRSGCDTVFSVQLENCDGQDLRRVQIALGVDNHLGQRIALISNRTAGQDLQVIPPGRNYVEVHVAQLPLRAGRYRVTLFADVNGEIADWVPNAAVFDVAEANVYGSGKLPPEDQGDLLLNYVYRLPES